MGETSEDRVVIVGGGVMGCSVAYHLLRARPGLPVAVVERDPTYRYASTVLSDGNLRVQFNLEENIRMSLHTLEVLETFSEETAVGDRRFDPAPKYQGNLFLVAEEDRTAAEAGLERQRALGCDVRWVSPEEIAEIWPPYAAEGSVGGTFGRRDGSVDPNAVLQGYRSKAADLGARFLEGEVARLLADGSMEGVGLASGDRLRSPVVVNCAGAWAADLAATVGVDLPVVPVRRHVYVVDTGLRPGRILPSVFLPPGVYAIPETESRYLVGWSLPDDPVGYDFGFSRQPFYDRIWPELVRHLPAFDRLHVVGGWAGLYAVNTLDGNAILGEWPELPGLYLANGFTGHGFQHAPAVGRYLAELILGLPPTLDLSRLGPERVLEGRPVREHAGRLI